MLEDVDVDDDDDHRLLDLLMSKIEQIRSRSAFFRRPIHSMGRLYISRCVCVCVSGHSFGPMIFCQNPSIVYIRLSNEYVSSSRI